MEQRSHNIVVRNTFIDAVVADDEEQLERTRSDPTGGRSHLLTQLGRLPERSEPIYVTEGSAAEEAGSPDRKSIRTPKKGSLCGIDEEGGPLDEDEDEDEAPAEEEEEEDDDDDGGGLLARTVSSAYPSANAAGMTIGLSQSSSSKVTTMALDRLLPDSDESWAARHREERSAASAAVAGSYGSFDPNQMQAWGYPPPYDMYGQMYAHHWQQAYEQQQQLLGQEDSAPSDGHPPAVPPLGSGAPVGFLHSFHQETLDMGHVNPDFRMFTKVGYEGRLSVVSESQVHTDGLHRYLVQFTSGELSRADGVGFVFSSRLPCAKNIQRIVSIFVNQRGRICMRVFADIVRASAYVKPLELGDWVELAMDLDKKVATFNIWSRTPSGWPPASGQPASTAEFPFGNKMARFSPDGAQGAKKGQGEAQAGHKPVKLNVGHLACVVKNVGVTVTICS